MNASSKGKGSDKVFSAQSLFYCKDNRLKFPYNYPLNIIKRNISVSSLDKNDLNFIGRQYFHFNFFPRSHLHFFSLLSLKTLSPAYFLRHSVWYCKVFMRIHSLVKNFHDMFLLRDRVYLVVTCDTCLVVPHLCQLRWRHSSDASWDVTWVDYLYPNI